MKKNYYSQCINKIKLLSVEEERTLYSKVKAGDKEAIDLLICNSLRTVSQIAQKYHRAEVEYFDLVQEGNLGLLHAAKTFDTTKGVRFNTYAIFWIRQYIQRFYHEKVRLVRIPVDQEALLHKLTKFKDSFLQEFGREPCYEEIGVHINRPVEYVQQLLIQSFRCMSLDHSLNDSGDLGSDGTKNAIFHTYEDTRYCPDAKVCEDFDKSCMHKALECLDERSKLVIQMRFGFFDKEYSLSEIGEKLEVSAETVRQIQLKATKKLKEFCYDNHEEMGLEI